jgi:hypothetical protein
MPYDWKTELPGIYARHADSCSRREGGVCICGPLGYRAAFTDPKTGRRTLSPDFADVSEAQAWLHEQESAARASAEPASGVREVGAVIEEYLQAAEQGRLQQAPGQPFTFESLRELRGALSYVDYELRSMSIEDVRRSHIRSLIDDLQRAGLPPMRVAGVVDALRSLYSFAIQRGLVDYSPVVELGLPLDSAARQPQPAWATQPVTPPPPPAPEWAATPPASTIGQGYYSGNGAYPTAAGPIPTPWTPPGGTPITGPWTPPHEPLGPDSPSGAYGTPSSGFRSILGVPPQTGPITGSQQADYDATMQERLLWWAVRITVIVFVLIALVLAAESV